MWEWCVNNPGIIAQGLFAIPTVLASVWGAIWWSKKKLDNVDAVPTLIQRFDKFDEKFDKAQKKNEQDNEAIRAKVDHLERNIIQQQNNLIEGIMKRLDIAENTIESLRKELKSLEGKNT